MQKSLSIASFVLGIAATMVSIALTVLQIVSLKKSRCVIHQSKKAYPARQAEDGPGAGFLYRKGGLYEAAASGGFAYRQTGQ